MSGENVGQRMPLWAEEINYALVEEQINQLLADPAIKELRTAAAEYVKKKLQDRMEQRLARTLEQVCLWDTQKLCQAVKQNMEKIGLSHRGFREFKLIAEKGQDEAMKFLKKVLLEKEMLRFQKETQISAKVWLNFIYSRIYTGEATLQKIRQQLALTPKEIQAFNRTVVANVFVVNTQLKETVHKLRQETGMSVSDFLTYAWVSRDAWESFYPIREQQEGKEKKQETEKKTSQKTLLKLIVGYGLSEQEAKDFLKLVNSAFVMRLDLVFLAGIRCGYNHPMEMQQILDFFSEDQNGEPFFPNPYR